MILLLVEFDSDGRPFTAYAQDAPERGLHVYDIDWCERDQCSYSHMSGGGALELWAGRRYWAARSVQEVRHAEGQTPKRLKRMPRPHSISSIVRLLESNETHVIYCSTCKDQLPTDDLCEHTTEAADDAR